MSKWILKALVQKTISFFPYKEKINYWFQKNITKGVRLDDQYFSYKIEHARDHLRFFNRFSENTIEKTTALELGTGWYPIIPIAFFLQGVEKTVSIDLSSWLSLDNLRWTCKKFMEWQERSLLENYLPNLRTDRWQQLVDLVYNEGVSFDEMCVALHFEPWVGDGRKTPFESQSFNFICSNNTFEHIPKHFLKDILIEFKRLISPNGLMSHFIDMTDHFAHFDQSITIYNFLQFSEKQWRLIDNNIQGQNRMRFIDYKKIYKELQIPISHEEVRQGNIDDLNRITPANTFVSYSREELAVSHGYLVSKLIK